MSSAASLAKKALSSLLSHPLLLKELREQANRKRTYALRVLLIGVLCLVACSLTQGIGLMEGQAVAGESLFASTLLVGFLAALAVIPGSMAGAVAAERERNSLPLLLVTAMRPWQIVVQKYLSRLIPSLMLLFLGLPLLAVAYSCGGLDRETLLTLPALLLCALVYAGAYSLAISCFCSNSVVAVGAAYLASFGQIALLAALESLDVLPSGQGQVWLLMAVMGGGSAICLVASVLFLKRRSPSRKNSALLKALSKLDAFWRFLNDRLGGVVLLKESPAIRPGEAPLAWVERAKSPVGRFSYKLRFCLILCLPAILAIFSFIAETGWIAHSDNWQRFICELLFLVYVAFAGTLLTALGVAAIAGERRSQTLEVMLSSPIEAQEIVKSKMRRGLAYTILLMVPIALLAVVLDFFAETSWHSSANVHCALAATLALVYFPLIRWFSCLLGLMMKSQAKAIGSAISAIIVWVFSPLILAIALESLLGREFKFQELAKSLFFSPFFPFASIAEGSIDVFYMKPAFYAWSIALAALAFLLKRICLAKADKFMRR